MSKEIMEFWSNEFGDLKKVGFKGKFRLEVVENGTHRTPTGSIKAFPIVGDKAIKEAIILIKEKGDWVVIRLFS